MWLQLVIVTLLAAIAQGVAGFGFTLLAVSFYLLTLRSTDAVQLVIVMNFAISVVLVARLWRAVPRGLWALLAGGGLLGFPFGLWLFARADLERIELAVAVVVIGFALTTLLQELRRGDGARRSAGASERRDWTADDVADSGADPGSPALVVPHRPLSALAVGLTAGAMTSALGAPGPPVVLYLSSLGVDKTTFRALALSTFIVMQTGALLGQVFYVGVDGRVWGFALVLVPVAAIGAIVGHRLCRHVSERAFRRVVLVLLLVTGGYMLWQGLAG